MTGAPKPDNDDTTMTAARVIMSPRVLAEIACFYTVLVLVSLCLTAAIRINAATLRYPEFQFRAMERLYITRALIGMRGVR